MSYGLIGTWKMVSEGIKEGFDCLAQGKPIHEGIIKAVENVENNPNFISVGYGGLPNQEGVVELDSAYMNGDTLGFGAIAAAKNIKNPIQVAHCLSNYNRNCVLVGSGAEQFAHTEGFAFSNMLTKQTQQRWLEKKQEGFQSEKLAAYAGHDTVCVLGQDKFGSLASGVSTSGLFMKHPGRVGDSPIIGSGFYADSKVGSAAATGVGEDIMKGCLSMTIVQLMKQGVPCQKACEKALFDHYYDMKERGSHAESMSVIAMDHQGNFGGATTEKQFPFVVQSDMIPHTIFVAQFDGKKHTLIQADEEWYKNYLGD